MGGARRLWHVPSGDKVSDLLVAGEVGILVLDVQALAEGPAVFIGQIKRQFPDLVVVVAGNRDAEISLAGLISAGTVYRFIHKPMSPGRAKLFADAAVKKFDEQRRRTAASVRRSTQIAVEPWVMADRRRNRYALAVTVAVHGRDVPSAEAPLALRTAPARRGYPRPNPRC